MMLTKYIPLQNSVVILLVTTIFITKIVLAVEPNAVPQNIQRIEGNIQIHPTENRDGINYMHIESLSPKAIIQSTTFDIGNRAHVDIHHQSNKDSLLWRVTASEKMSEIEGKLTSNGNLFLINPNHVVIRNGAMVDVGGLITSTLNISNQDFLNGN
jgi:filamentous hemagglutinin family protein